MNQSATNSSSSSSNVLVAVRVRPLNANEVSNGVKSCMQVFDGRIVAIKKNGDAAQYLKSQQLCINEYEYDVVFDEKSPQQDIYDKTAKSFIPKLINGQNVTVFAYGATGAGKTHTMLGDTRIEEMNLVNKGKGNQSLANHNGIIPNAVKDVFRLISAKISKNLPNQSKALFNEQYSVFVTFLEVYNEQVYDLLEPSGKILAVREDQEKGIVVVAGVTEQPVATYLEVIDLIIQGNKQRKTESTMANALSSRSHAVLQLLIKKTTKLENGKETITESKLSMIDLAGSERASATNNRGLRLQEGAKINQSLLALANCINALAENSANTIINNNNSIIAATAASCASSSFASTSTATTTATTTSSSSSSSAISKPMKNVKFRDSKLTHLLKSSLEGNCHLIMIADINPSDQTYEDSHNTLKYANRAKNIKVHPLTIQKEVKDINWIEREGQLREENVQLKQVIHQLELQVQQLQGFQNYVMKFKRIPGSEEEIIIDSSSHQDTKNNIISQKMQDSVNQQLLSFATDPSCMEEDENDDNHDDNDRYNRYRNKRQRLSNDSSLLDSSLSSLSTAQDLISDYLSTSQEGGRSFSSSDDMRLSTSNEEDHQLPSSSSPKTSLQKNAVREEEVIEEFEFDIVGDVNQMIMMENQRLSSSSSRSSSLSQYHSAAVIPFAETNTKQEANKSVDEKKKEENEKDEDVFDKDEDMIVNNFTQKRRKLADNRRKSISITRRKSFIPTFSNKMHDESSADEMEVDDEATPLPSVAPLPLPLSFSTRTVEPIIPVTAVNDDLVDDIALSLDVLPKVSEEPVMSSLTNLKKRRASNLPVPSAMAVQTRSMRRQSLSATPSNTTSSSSSSSSFANHMEPFSAKTVATTTSAKVEPAVTNIAVNNNKTDNDENISSSSNKRASSSTITNKKDNQAMTTPSSNTITKRGVLTESNTVKTSTNNTSSSATNITKSANNATEKTTKASVKSKTTNNTNNYGAGKENQENPFEVIVASSQLTTEKPNKALEFDDFQIDWLGTSVSVSTAAPAPPSPTRRETRRMSMANRKNSLAKVTAMLDSVSHNVNTLGFSFSGNAPPPPPAQAALTSLSLDHTSTAITGNTAARSTRSMR